MDKQGKVGVLTKIFILMILSSLAFISMWSLYANIVSDYGDELGYEEEPTFREISDSMADLLNTTSDDSVEMTDAFGNVTGTQTRWEDSMILSGFSTIKRVMKASFLIIEKTTENAATWFNIPKFWVNGFLAIFLIVVLIVVVAGFLKAVNW